MNRSRLGLTFIVIPFLLLLTQWPSNLVDQLLETTPEVTPTQMPTEDPSSQASGLNETDLLRAQLETMKEYDRKLLQTVYWSLAGITMLAVLVAGFSWFSNLRLYQRDREALREELLALVTSSLSELREENFNSLREIQETVDQMIDEHVSSKTSEFDRKIEWIRSDSSRLRANQYELEARIWEAEGILANALTYYTYALSSSIEIGYTGGFSSTLTSIIRVLSEISSVSSWDSSNINPIIDKLPSDYVAEVTRIRELLNEKLSA
jgi:hypothetical protein